MTETEGLIAKLKEVTARAKAASDSAIDNDPNAPPQRVLMVEIKDGHVHIAEGDKVAGPLTWDEAIGCFAALILKGECRFMETPEARAACRQRYGGTPSGLES